MGNKMVDVWFGENILPGKYAETNLDIYEYGFSSIDSVKNVGGVIIVCDNNTYETLGEYRVKLA